MINGVDGPVPSRWDLVEAVAFYLRFTSVGFSSQTALREATVPGVKPVNVAYANVILRRPLPQIPG